MAYRLGNRILKIDNKLFYSQGAAVFPTVGLLSYWRLDETSGTVIYDAIGGKNGILEGGTINNVGKHNKCWNNVSSSVKGINCGNNYDFSLSKLQPWSINCWINLNKLNVWQFLPHAQNNTSPNGGYGVRVKTNNKLYMHLWGNGGIEVESKTVTVTTGQWYMATFTYNGSVKANGCTIYQDSNKLELTIINDSSFSSSFPTIGQFHVVGRSDTKFPLFGSIDEVGIWNRVLSQDEVTALYNAGNGLFY